MAPRSIALLVILLGLAVQPVLAHESAGGTPAVTITVTTGVSDREVRVPAGAVVRFRNSDDERHRFRSRDREGFDTGNIEPGEFAQVRVGSAGTYVYIDERTDDPGYAGRIVVGGGSAGSKTAPTGGARRTATVTIGDRIFQPGVTRLAVGGAVTFRNADRDDHTATGGIIDSGPLRPGASYQQTFRKPGTYDFLCIFHPDMRGTIEVIAAADSVPATAKPTATPTPAATPAATPAGTPAAAAGSADTSSVQIVDLAFKPAALEVPSGATVRWTNTGVAPHTATAKDGAFDSGTLETGGTFEFTFTSPGTYAYVCNVHPDMTGTIAVLEETAVALSSASTAPDATQAGVAAAASRAPVTDGPATAVDAAPAADLSSLGGIGLAVLMVSIATALFARLVQGTVRD